MIGRFFGTERGATAVEYGLIAALVAMTVMAGMQLTGGGVNELYDGNRQQIGGAIESAGS